MRRNVLDTLYNLVDHSTTHINEILEHCNLCKKENRHALCEHVDNLKDAIHMLEMIGEEELYMKLHGACHSMTSQHAKDMIDKPVIMKKSSPEK